MNRYRVRILHGKIRTKRSTQFEKCMDIGTSRGWTYFHGFWWIFDQILGFSRFCCCLWLHRSRNSEGVTQQTWMLKIFTGRETSISGVFCHLAPREIPSYPTWSSMNLVKIWYIPSAPPYLKGFKRSNIPSFTLKDFKKIQCPKFHP